jgi:hypothetical protein
VFNRDQATQPARLSSPMSKKLSLFQGEKYIKRGERKTRKINRANRACQGVLEENLL